MDEDEMPPIGSNVPRTVLTFLREIAHRQDAAWFRAERAPDESRVAEPMRALLRELEGAFGPGALFRPYRDLRFTADRRPLKESLAGHLGPRRRTGMRTVHLTTERLAVRVGCRPLSGDLLRDYRRAVLHETSGMELQRVVDGLDPTAGRCVGRTLARGPRDVPHDAPRQELLRHTFVAVTAEHPVGPWMRDPEEVVARVARTLAAGEPLLGWLRANLEPAINGARVRLRLGGRGR